MYQWKHSCTDLSCLPSSAQCSHTIFALLLLLSLQATQLRAIQVHKHAINTSQCAFSCSI